MVKGKGEKYQYSRSSREGMADVWKGSASLGIWPYHIAEELCVSANMHFGLLQKIADLEQQIASNTKLQRIAELEEEVKTLKENK